VLLTLLVPGLGHAWAGRRTRGAAFFGLVGAPFALGLTLGGALGSLPAPTFGSLLATVATHALVAPSLVAHALRLDEGDPRSPSFEAGTTYLVVAGVLNVLLALDAGDVAEGRKP
jgi:hypothetical protein